MTGVLGSHKDHKGTQWFSGSEAVCKADIHFQQTPVMFFFVSFVVFVGPDYAGLLSCSDPG